MVSFAELREAKPYLWTAAAEDLRKAAKQSERVAEDVHSNGVNPLNEHWPDHVGQLAVGVLKKVATKAEVTSVLSRAGVEPVDALSHAVIIAQNELENAVHFAEANGLTVDALTGKVSLAQTSGGRNYADLVIAANTAQQLINDAVEAATQADALCTSALQRASASAANPDTTVEQAQEVQSQNIRSAVEEIRDTLPDGLPPSEVRQWWENLTPQEQFDLKRAVPVELHDLPGIPDDVKAELTNNGSGYNPVGAVRWATANAHNESIDRLDSNCTLFASEALRASGLSEKDGQWSKQDWLNPVPNIPGYGGKDIDRYRYTPSWFNADAQREFLLNNGGWVVPVSEARPGDVVYFNYADPSAHGDGLQISHHTAVVSSVLPDGEVLYTQHTPGAVGLSLQDRLPMIARNEGAQTVTIVRP